MGLQLWRGAIGGLTLSVLRLDMYIVKVMISISMVEKPTPVHQNSLIEIERNVDLS